jgi:SAM-dependent methyltransferase
MTDPFGIYARFYDLDYAAMDADLSMIEEFSLRCGSPILELACGTGRVLTPLASQGYQVTGVDISAAMLDITRRKVTAEGLGARVTLLEQDMRTLEVDGRFNLALVVGNSFLHLLTTDDQVSTLDRIRQHLNPGGLLLLDIFNPDLNRLLDFRGQMSLAKVMTEPETGRRLMKYHTQTADLGRQIIDVTFIIDEVDSQGQVLRTLFPFSLRYLFRGELELLLRYAGFDVETVYGSYDLDDYTADSDRMIAVARRPQ